MSIDLLLAQALAAPQTMRSLSALLLLLAATTTPTTVATHVIFVVADDLGFNDGMSPSQSLLALCAAVWSVPTIGAWWCALGLKSRPLAPLLPHAHTPTLVRY